MTSVYKEQGNGHHTAEEEKLENGQESPSKVKNILTSDELSSEFNTVEQQFKSWRKQLQEIAIKIRQAPDRDALLNVAVTQIREKIACSRALIYRFNSLSSGTILAESVAIDWTPTLGENLPAIIFGLPAKQDYLEAVIINDINQLVLSPYQSQLLEKYQIKASFSLPIFVDEELWGLLVVNNCSAARLWQEMEISLLSQIIAELNYKLQNFEFQAKQLLQVQEKKSIVKIIDKIQRASNLDTIFQTTTQEVRKLLQCDRVSVYRFNPDWSGEYVAESVAAGWIQLVGAGIKTVWEDTHLQETRGGRYRNHQSYVANDIYKMGHAPCHIDILEQFEIKAYAIIPLFCGEKLWGLLAAYQNTGVRNWQDWELGLLEQIAVQFGIAVAQAESLEQVRLKSEQLAQISEQEKALAKVVNRIRQTLDLDAIFRATTQEVRQLLQFDRVCIYRFNPDWSGEYVSESVATGWARLVGPEIKTVWEDSHLQETQGGRYAKGESFTVNDIQLAGHSRCHLDILEQFEVKAYVIVPVFIGQKLWGLLSAYQNSGVRHWQTSEVNLLTQVALQLGVALSQAEYLQQVQGQTKKLATTEERQRSLIVLTRKIGELLVEKVADASGLEAIFQTTVAEIRKLLQADRTVIYRFNPDWSGDFLAESVGKGWIPFKDRDFEMLADNTDCSIKELAGLNTVKDTYLQETQGGRYQQKTSCVVNDVTKAGFPKCYTELLEQFQAKAYLTVPIFKDNKLWGLLANYQNSQPREWEEFEVNMMHQIAALLGVAIQQVEAVEKLQRQSLKETQEAERDRTATKVIDRIRQSLDIDTIFSITTKEVRMLLSVDRAVVYKFNPDWSGSFVSESTGFGWSSLIDNQYKIKRLQESVSDCNAMRSLITSSEKKTNANLAPVDTYLQETQGGELRDRKSYAIADIYKAGFSRCYVEVLEQYECKAYAIVPIFQGEKLWGMLATYQNSGPRQWEDSEVRLLRRIGDQLGVALQQAGYLQQLQAKSEEIEKGAERVKFVTQIVERIRQSTEVNALFNSTASEVRGFLSADRVGVFRFLPGSGYDDGEFIAEDVLPGFVSALKNKVHDHCFGSDYAAGYREGRIQAVADIYNAGFTQCHIDILSKFQIIANLIVPLIKGDELWGLLCIHQCKAPREWQPQEIELVRQIANQFGVALQQAEYLQELKIKSAELTEVASREKQDKEAFQKAAMQLLAAVRPALDGNLTVRAPITEDVLGTIADAYNNTLQALRQIVIQVQAAAQQVAQTSTNSNASLGGLTKLAQQQSKEINEALGEIQQMVDSTQAVVANAELVQIAVQEANETVESGDVAMNRTVEAIQGIRETVAQTSKKIKRLSESSQKISKVVSLISNFATQTNVLALNAAIEATRAGEYGKGFAVVADEVRSLSRQSAAATIEIEKLVQEIQQETGEVAVAMEIGIQQVVEGTSLVNETRQNLNAIVSSTAEISQLLQRIGDANQAQMLQSISVTASMKDVEKISNKTSIEANEIATVFQELSGMAQDLLASVSKFKVN